MTALKPKLHASRTYNFWVVARRSPDVPGEWEAHCLELDVVTQGRSLEHSFQMAVEAVSMTLASDLATRRDPLERRAPQSFWDDLWQLLKGGELIKMKDAFAAGDKIGVLAAQLLFAVEVDQLLVAQAQGQTRPPTPLPRPAPRWNLPAAWSASAA